MIPCLNFSFAPPFGIAISSRVDRLWACKSRIFHQLSFCRHIFHHCQFEFVRCHSRVARLSRQTRAFHRRSSGRRFLGAAPRDQPRRHHSPCLWTVPGVRAHGQFRPRRNALCSGNLENRVNPNSEVGEHARPGRGWTRPRVQPLVRDCVSRRVCTIPCAAVFREGAENSAQGGRAPFSISEFG